MEQKALGMGIKGVAVASVLDRNETVDWIGALSEEDLEVAKYGIERMKNLIGSTDAAS